MEKRAIEIYKKQFDDIRHEENGVEFWYARELMELLEYAQWRNFEKTIDKAKISCENNGIAASDHFADVSKMIKIGKGGNREVDEYIYVDYDKKTKILFLIAAFIIRLVFFKLYQAIP